MEPVIGEKKSIPPSDKTPDFVEICMMVLGISRLEAEILGYMLDNPHPICINALADVFGRHKSLIQRSITKLMEHGLVTRRKMNLTDFLNICRNYGIGYTPETRRGYLYIYHALPKNRLKDILRIRSREIFERILRGIEMI